MTACSAHDNPVSESCPIAMCTAKRLDSDTICGGQRQTARADSSVPQDRPHLGGQSQVLVVTCTSDQLAVNQRVPSLGLINEVEQLRNWGNPLTHQAAILSQRMLEEGMTQKPGEEVHRARAQTKELLSPA